MNTDAMNPSNSVLTNDLLTCRVLLPRFDPSLFETFFPVLRPRAAEIIDEARLARNQLGRLAFGTVDDRALHPALDEDEPPVRIAERRALLAPGHRVQRTAARLPIAAGRVDGDGPGV